MLQFIRFCCHLLMQRHYMRRHAAGWGLGSTMSPVPMNTQSPMGIPAPSACQQPTGLIWINYLSYCSNFVFQTSTFPGRKQPFVYYRITIGAHQLNVTILCLIISMLIIITPLYTSISKYHWSP